MRLRPSLERPEAARPICSLDKSRGQVAGLAAHTTVCPKSPDGRSPPLSLKRVPVCTIMLLNACYVPCALLSVGSQHRTKERSKFSNQGSPTFWRPWATLEEEESPWATHEIHGDMSSHTKSHALLGHHNAVLGRTRSRRRPWAGCPCSVFLRPQPDPAGRRPPAPPLLGTHQSGAQPTAGSARRGVGKSHSFRELCPLTVSLE